LSVWDRIFKTYTAQPEAGHINMTIGLMQYRDEKIAERLDGMLLIPFKENS
jgi:sterol desaturase/sphingolipid hydroxylase (fatty acid hydroxylase superfamily)